MSNPPQALVIGAGSAIATSLIVSLLDKGYAVTAVSRKPAKQLSSKELTWHETEYTDQAIAHICKTIASQDISFSNIFICNGLLHTQEVMPEKQINQFSSESFLTVLSANTLTPMLWISHLPKLLTKGIKTEVVIFSARVGSIGDNRLGGWYSYRASKAALNMLVKTSAIELKRRFKQAQFILFHPGTTQSPLSKPFTQGSNNKTVFTPEFVATQLLSILEQGPQSDTCLYLDWQGKAIDW
ncbi:SDR family NAD(P)-dependent oxidoreductase [Thalassotalea agarivorans]|uniref:NAD(P)-dependent dehydrogenase, short-chain alcohol dehydrogenase family n=1 Tax=Thalassotalea agarivorans TaxID=349064 RepID=A0A1I0CCV9_THASX|nr:SDR family NAD(P)-dependent oxidoreductase [Thalassotalea agarivorans]SET17373.1 NAD(P)-dependent dehydrogenase, short-chain alcohol dehydrogenase family [Thalassotalea agarivorans]